MLSELRVSQLGVIEELSLVLGPGMTALTGETGAGKTLVVEAVELLLGGRADGALVRPGAAEAVVEGRFVMPPGWRGTGGAEDNEGSDFVISRVVPAEGRSRAYVDGRMASLSALAATAEGLVDLHGQHAHQSLLSPAAQRAALDAYAGADRRPRDAARARLREVEGAMASAGGDGAAREREAELLIYQLAELDGAELTGPEEESALGVEEDSLAMAASHRAAALATYDGLVGDDQVLDRLGVVVAGLAGHSPLNALYERLRALCAELADVGSELRSVSEVLEEDPVRLAEVVSRRALLRELRRKYGGRGAGLEAVLAFQREAGDRLGQLRDQEGLAAKLARDHIDAVDELRRAAEKLGATRRGAVKAFGQAVEAELRRLAMPRARFEVDVGGSASGGGGDSSQEGALSDLSGEVVTFLLAANPGEPLLPLSKVASGGELARAMLALRLVLVGRSTALRDGGLEGPTTLVFDEVDAGVGGEAALAVGKALAELGRGYQVIVVTHLAQVAAFAGVQVRVSKVERDGRSVALAAPVTGPDRVIELSRMMSGRPDSQTARLHAEELLRAARPGDHHDQYRGE